MSDDRPLSRDNFFQAGGTLDPNAPSYIVREADEQLWGLILSAEYCHVLTARQMGKSSLIMRAQQRLKNEKVRSVFIDLTSIGAETIYDYANVNVHIHIPNIDFTLEEIGTNPVNLTKTLRLTNNGDPITNFTVSGDENLSGLIYFDPVI